MPARMTSADVNLLFRRAEQAFASGQFTSARRDLAAIEQAAPGQPPVLHLRALVERRLGNVDAAREAFEAALKLAPADPQILNNYANHLDSLGQREEALARYDQALAAKPNFEAARFARALTLQKLGRAADALEELDQLLRRKPQDARYHSARGSVLRDLGRLGDAAAAFQRSLQLDPARPIALRGRARVALERGEEAAPDWYHRALTAEPGNPELHLGYAEALEANGGAVQAIDHLTALVQQQTEWVEGQAMLARIRGEAGHGDQATSLLEQAAAAARRNKGLWLSLVAALAGSDRFAQAAATARRGWHALGDDADLQLLEALYTSESGDLPGADGLFGALPSDLPLRSLHQASHHLRAGRLEQAAQALDQARREQPESVPAWALSGLVWRMMEDGRAVWLNEQDGLVATASLELSDGDLRSIIDRLRSLHRTRAHPIGQSLRGGTQTRGRLFDRAEPELQMLAEAVHRNIRQYWNALPLTDPAHPLLRHRSSRPTVEGSWSVRLTDGGFHVAHFHSHGHLSSAAYFVVPAPSAPMEGWLEIGGPPANLNLPLEPLRRVQPAPGIMALFPSYLFHGTRPFSSGERLTVAFDVVAR